jgi:DNA-binding MarR family transcriptional regulator
MQSPMTGRFGFLVSDAARLYSQQFDRLAREKLGLTRAQCQLLAVLAAHEDSGTFSQAELAQRMGITPMGVAKLCDRMAAAGWIERRAHPDDKRVNRLHVKPAARKALERALAIGDELTGQALAGFSAAERSQVTGLLARARQNLLDLGAAAKEEEAA